MKKSEGANWSFILTLIGTVAGVIGTIAAVISILPKSEPPVATSIPASATSQVVRPDTSPTDTPPVNPTLPPAPAPTFTPLPPANVNRAFPCEATVNPNSTSSTLNVVRQFPNTTSDVVASVQRGQDVTVLERSAGTSAFYSIQANGRTIGWIAGEHLVLSATCPT